MKATGIVRRLDDLGRLVIPKEMRRQYRLKEGDSIEFFTEEDRIIIEKYNVFSRSMEEIETMCDIMKKRYAGKVLFLQEEWLRKQKLHVSDAFLKRAGVHRTTQFSDEKVFADAAARYQGWIFPITAYGDWYGAFVLLQEKEAPRREEIAVMEAFAALLSAQQEH